MIAEIAIQRQKKQWIEPIKPQMTKDQLISLVRKILGTDVDLKFLAKLDLAELRLLVACIRDNLEDEKR